MRPDSFSDTPTIFCKGRLHLPVHYPCFQFKFVRINRTWCSHKLCKQALHWARDQSVMCGMSGHLQVATFLKTSRIAPTDICMIFGGTSDYFALASGANVTVPGVIQSLVASAVSLVQAGAQRWVFPGWNKSKKLYAVWCISQKPQASSQFLPALMHGLDWYWWPEAWVPWVRFHFLSTVQLVSQAMIPIWARPGQVDRAATMLGAAWNFFILSTCATLTAPSLMPTCLPH